MPDPETLYQILGVAADATYDDIKRAYRKGAAAHHPDRNPGDRDATRRFQRVALAYAVLSDPDKRAVYDRELTARRRHAPGSSRKPVSLDDLFGSGLDVLVKRVKAEGITFKNVDSIFEGVAHLADEASVRVPRQAVEQARRASGEAEDFLGQIGKIFQIKRIRSDKKP